MLPEKQSLFRADFAQHLKSIVTKIKRENKFTDVTLVCNDRTQFQAHRFILSASSPVFDHMLSGINHQNPIIFLHGIQSEIMNSLLQCSVSVFWGSNLW